MANLRFTLLELLSTVGTVILVGGVIDISSASPTVEIIGMGFTLLVVLTLLIVPKLRQ